MISRNTINYSAHYTSRRFIGRDYITIAIYNYNNDRKTLYTNL